MEHRESDLESFLLGGMKNLVKREAREDVSTKDLPSRGSETEDVENPSMVSGRATEYDKVESKSKSKPGRETVESGNSTMEFEALHKGFLDGNCPSRTMEFEALHKGFLDGNCPSRLVRYVRGLNWVWGGSKYSGSACMAISSASYSLMGLFVKLLAVRSIPSSQIVMFRCGLISLVAGVNLRQMRHPLLGSPRVRRLVLARAVVGFIALSAYFYSIQILPLRDATVLNFTTPVFTIILGTSYLNENWNAAEAAGTFCSFLGVLLVTQPQIFSAGQHSRDTNTWDLYLGVAIALGAAAMGALSYILVRIIGQHGEPPLVCVFAFAAFSTPMAALGTLLQGYKSPDVVEVMFMLLVGLLAYFAQVFLTRSLQLEKASIVTPIQYLKVLFTFILGVTFLHEIPTLWDVLGAILITGSAASISYKSTS